MDGLKHTPGPWKKESHRNIVNLESKTIVDIAVVLGGYESEEADANLRLMLMAPEMCDFMRSLEIADGNKLTQPLWELRCEILEKVDGFAAINEKTCDETKGNYEDNPLLALYDEVVQESNIKSEISCVIGLTQVGETQMWKGICPFHQDHRPSLQVNEDSQKFKCLSCGESGDIVDFSMKYRKTSEKDALIHLAENAGINPNDFLKDSK